MPSHSVPVVTPIPFVAAQPQYLSLRDSILDDFGKHVPSHLRLPASVIDSPPKSVIGIPRECGILTPDEIHITEDYDATTLAAAIASRKFSAVAVAVAFAKRAMIAHQLTCCLTEWFMDEAVEQAKRLDAYLEATGETVGPLHGVPVSIKVKISIKGHWLGLSSTAKPPSRSLMHLESLSIHGRTLNPHNINLTSGGSSGGEGALLALRGSIMGVGTDIGGSIRCPAGFCGIYGFRPTSYIVPTKDYLSTNAGFAGELNILGCAGPMCTSLQDMDLFMAVVLSAKPYLEDPRLIPTPWVGVWPRDSAEKPLKVGIMLNDGVIVPQPPVLRALEWVRSRIATSASFEIKEFRPFQAEQAMRNIRKAYWPDGGRSLKDHILQNKEPLLPLTAWTIKDAEDVDVGAFGLLQQRLARDNFRCDFAAHWASQDVDVVICPVFVGPACAHNTAFYWNYTAFWNYVDYPGAAIPTPIKALKKGLEDYPADITPLSDQCKHVRQLWAEGDFEGAPVNVQVIGRRYHDKELFAALKRLDKVLEG